MKYCLLLIVSFFTACNIYSQGDTAFWFVAPDLQEQHGDRPVFLRISSLSNAAVITISQPANPSFPLQTINLAANSSQSVDLTAWIDLLENSPVNTVLNKGLLIRSSSKISCYYDIASYANGDMYVLKGKNALGKKFTIPFQQSFYSPYYGLPFVTASFEVLATEDNTTISILPSKNLMGHPAGVSFTIILNKGQTYSCAAESNDPAGRPGGTIVTSDKPVCISITDDSISYPGYTCADTAGDQLIPDALAGTEFVIIRGYLSGPDHYFVFATGDNTVVRENGLVVSTLNTGQYYTGLLNAEACFVETSKAVQVFHMSGFGCELGGAVIPSLKCTGSSSVSLTRATDQNLFTNIISPPGITGGFMFNGQNSIITPAQFQIVPGSGGAWMYAKILVDNSVVPPGGIAKIENNLGKFHVGLIHGDQVTTCRYGFFSDFGNSSLQIVNNLSSYCLGSSVSITAVSSGATSFIWEGPNGYVSNVPNLTINNFQPSQQGVYKVTAMGNICGSAIDSFFIGILYPTQLTINASICQGQSYSGYTTSGTYVDTLVAANGCDSVRTLNLTAKPGSFSTITQSICQGQNFESHPTSGTYIDTLVAANGCDSVRTLILTVKPRSVSTITQSICQGQNYEGYPTSGTYLDTFVAANGCDSIRTIHLTVLPVIQPNLGVDTILCTGDSLRLYPGSFNSYNWQNGATQSNITVKQGGLYSVIVTDNCHTGRDEILITENACDIYFPSAFTPNNDGKNDWFKILGGYNLKEYHLVVYNRWGQKVFETSDLANGWNGIFNGQLQPPAIFVWYCEFKKPGHVNKSKMSGTVALIR